MAGVALDLVTLAERAAARRQPTARLHVAVVHRADRLRLLVYDNAADSPGDPILQLTEQPAAGERGWQELLEHELSLFRRTGTPFAVALIDLDDFKSYNDTHGHLAADRLLRHSVAAWRSALRETDVLARWGGDEFVVLLPACDAFCSEGVIDRMLAACPEAAFSAGLAQSVAGSTPESMLDAADAALYRSKRAGSTRISAVSLAA